MCVSYIGLHHKSVKYIVHIILFNKLLLSEYIFFIRTKFVYDQEKLKSLLLTQLVDYT